MASTLVMPGSKVTKIEIQSVAPKPGGVNLVVGMLSLIVVASAWAALVVGLHFLELHFLGN